MTVRVRFAVAIGLAWLVAAVPFRAQSPNTAALVVIVSDQSGAPVADARVAVADRATGATREDTSGRDGRVVVAALPVGGVYAITVTKQGFEPEEVGDTTLHAGEMATLRVRLRVGEEKSEITVYGTTEGVHASPQLGERLGAVQIDETPIPGRKVTYLPMLNSAFRTGKGTGDLFLNAVFSVTGAGGRRELDFAIDGATGDEPWGRQTMFSTVPVSAVEQMNVMSSAFSAEYGWTAGQAINVVTKSGTNDVHGDLLYLGRPGDLQPRSAKLGDSTIVTPDVPDLLHQVSGSIGAPLARSRAFLFAAADYTAQDRTAYFANVPATIALLNGVTSYAGKYRQGLLDARVDYKVNSSTMLMGRVNVDRFSDDNPQDVVSGTTLPSAGRVFRRHTWSAQGNATSALSSSTLNELRLVYQDGDPITDFDPLSPSTQFVRSGVATEGESRYSHVWSRQVQLSDTLTWSKRLHFVRAGGSLARATSGGDGTEFGGAFVLGQFTINPAVTRPIDQLTIADATRYTQTFNLGANDYSSEQWIYALFVQDSLQLRPDFTVDAGLRYDRQTFSDGTKNFAPRVGFGWHPGGSAMTAVRGGYGVYYTMLRANLDASFTLNGPEGQFSYSAAPGQPGFPSSLTAVPIAFPTGTPLPARNITVRPGRADYYARFFNVSKLNYPDALVNPKSQLASIGVEHEFGHGLQASADYVWQHWTGLDRTVDLNAPSLFVRTAPGQVRSAAVADATRPITPTNNGFRQINAVVNLGVADYDGLQTAVRWRNARAFVSLSYTISKATNTTEPNGNGPNPNDYNQLGEEERGPSILDQRQRAVIVANVRLPHAITVGTVTSLASARPYNATTGIDNNGDGATNDRPVIDGTVVSRTAFRGTALHDVTVFAEAALKRNSRGILLRADVYNLFNHGNVLGRIGVYGDAATPSATFGTPNTGIANLDPARQVEFEVRFTF